MTAHQSPQMKVSRQEVGVVRVGVGYHKRGSSEDLGMIYRDGNKLQGLAPILSYLVTTVRSEKI